MSDIEGSEPDSHLAALGSSERARQRVSFNEQKFSEFRALIL
jgi:hypothetical protein